MIEFPTIAGVDFKLIPDYKSGSRVYAVSSDKRIWIGEGKKWNKVEPYLFHDGDMVVRLGNPNGIGGRPLKVEELWKAAFK